ncbi:hypothetical protein C7C46_08970 [Streptomyces tateyamensis]|uniref:Uncharacterized protein n=1 Tax=Streptomyces tateyamensis TaxID=565073 RepID=A0A2V4P1K8_9ACTN|nr:hypothetical protein [Streptomyces tateyamensis]PYC83454.1 hypothetical protein C7C46_08970 [Streptomyces tateyamensis]
MPDITELLARATPRELTVPVCLDGQAAQDAADLQLQLEQAAGWQATSLGDVHPGAALAADLQVVRARVAAATVHVRLVAIGHTAYSALLACHPAPAGSNERYDAATFLPALVEACAAEPRLTAEQVVLLLESVNTGTAEQLFGAALLVNEEPSPIPF